MSAHAASAGAVSRRRGGALRSRGIPSRTVAAPTATVLLASEGRPFSRESLALATELAGGAGGTVHVLSIARVHGVSFGLPNPGLLPTRAEWDEQRDQVRRAVRSLGSRGLRAHGEVLGTRKATQRICGAAETLGCSMIVMGADRSRLRLVADMLWSQEPQRVQRRAKIPVHLAIDS